jgi:hypothetical protein
MANQRSGVPAGWHWRDGHPRWIPSPTLRRAGWKGRDLKDAAGRWLARGASIDAAQALVAAVAAWKAGGLVPPALAASAPPGAGQTPGAGLPVAAEDRRSLGALLDAYLGAPERAIAPSREFEAIRNKPDRRSKLSRLLDVLAGYPLKPTAAADLPRYQAARARVRSFSIDVLEPPAFEDTPDLSQAQGPLYDAYWTLHEKVGRNMAHGVLGDTSAFLEWCVKRRALRQNWAKLVDRETPPGRIRVGTWPELRALISAAEAMGLPSIADSIILGVDLSWSQTDRLKLTWGQISADNTVKGTRQKTGRKGETPLLATLGVPRLQQIRARQAERFGPNVTPTHVILCDLTGKPWSARYYRQKFDEVRTQAAKAVPSVATLLDLDLRDTAITVGKAAGLSNEEIATRSLHSMKRIADVLDKHYTELGQDIANAGAKKLNDYLAAGGIRL